MRISFEDGSGEDGATNVSIRSRMAVLVSFFQSMEGQKFAAQVAAWLLYARVRGISNVMEYVMRLFSLDFTGPLKEFNWLLRGCCHF